MDKKIVCYDVREVYNNRLESSVEVEINKKYRGMSPTGASTGTYEAKCIPTALAIRRLRNILRHYIGEIIDFKKLDAENKFLKEKIGSNGSIALSYALFNADFEIKDNRKYVFPLPLSNVVGGGKHNGSMHIQEVLIAPKKAKSFPEAFSINRNVFLELREYFKKKGIFLGYNDESALITTLKEKDTLDIVHKIASKYDAYIGVDFASNSYYNPKIKKYDFLGKKLNKEQYLRVLLDFIEEYDLKYIEDPFYETDFESFGELNDILGKRALIVGDDLTTTNMDRLEKALENKSINAMIIKPNQIGTVSESIEVYERITKEKGVGVISHRSGEGDDATISRISIEYGFKLAKFGISGIRVVKINELIRLWNRVDNKSVGNPWKGLKK